MVQERNMAVDVSGSVVAGWPSFRLVCCVFSQSVRLKLFHASVSVRIAILGCKPGGGGIMHPRLSRHTNGALAVEAEIARAYTIRASAV